MYMDMQDKKLAMDAAIVATVFDDGNVASGGSEYWDDGVHYADNVVQIWYNPTNGAMEIERVENRNPVVCLRPVSMTESVVMMLGKCIRTHGESRFIRDHVAKLRESAQEKVEAEA